MEHSVPNKYSELKQYPKISSTFIDKMYPEPLSIVERNRLVENRGEQNMKKEKQEKIALYTKKKKTLKQ